MSLKFLYTFDYFALHPQLYFNGRYYYSTILGSCLSVLLLIGILVYFINYILIMIDKSEPKLITTIYNDEDPKLIHLKENNFALTISLQDVFYNNFIDESIYKLTANKLKVILNEDGTSTMTSSKIHVIKCSEYEFKIIPEYFKNLPLDHLYCLNETDIEIQGQFMQPIWQFITFEFSKCVNETSEIVCAPEDVIDKQLNGGFVGMFVTDFNIVPNNFSHPSYIYGRNIYSGFSATFYLDLWIYLKPIEIITDQGIIFENKKIIDYFAYDSMKHDVYFKDGNVFASVTIRDSPRREVYERSYTKIQDASANIGGIINLFLTLGEWFIFCFRFLLYKNYFLQFFSENKGIFLDSFEIRNSRINKIKGSIFKRNNNKLNINKSNTNTKYAGIEYNSAFNINLSENKSSGNLYKNSTDNKNNTSACKKINNENELNLKLKKYNDKNLIINNNNQSPLFDQNKSRKIVIKKNLLNYNTYEKTISCDSNNFPGLLKKNENYFNISDSKIQDNRSIIIFCCQKDACFRIKNVHEQFAKINFLFDLVHIIKTRNEINLIENILFNKEQKKLLSSLYKFNTDFLSERLAYEDKIKHKKLKFKDINNIM
jgi:hypothetical protein